MTAVVVDASVALSWCFPDETNAYADEVLAALDGRTILVPAIWPLEIANALLAGERRKRLKQPEVRRFLALLNGLSIRHDTPASGDGISGILPVAREHHLSAYDAAYLELAARRSIPLATLDSALQKAARQADVGIFLGE